MYVQTVPSACFVLMTPQAEFEIGVAQIRINDEVIPLQDVVYDFWGNHHNDMLTFTYGNQVYSNFHSSYDVGHHSCRNMDCVNIFELSGNMLERGCGCDRTRPVICVQQQEDGSFPELVDTFAPCDEEAECF